MPLFPLSTVLFPDGVLPLQVFEVRYLDMISRCIVDGTPFVKNNVIRGLDPTTGRPDVDPAIEVDAQPTTNPRPVGRDVQPGACGAGHLRLLVDIDRCEDAGLSQRQRRHQPAHSRTDNHCPHPVVLPK